MDSGRNFEKNHLFFEYEEYNLILHDELNRLKMLISLTIQLCKVFINLFRKIHVQSKFNATAQTKQILSRIRSNYRLVMA